MLLGESSLLERAKIPLDLGLSKVRSLGGRALVNVLDIVDDGIREYTEARRGRPDSLPDAVQDLVFAIKDNPSPETAAEIAKRLRYRANLTSGLVGGLLQESGGNNRPPSPNVAVQVYNVARSAGVPSGKASDLAGSEPVRQAINPFENPT